MEKGKIIKINGNKVSVEMVPTKACENCKGCMLTSSGKRVITEVDNIIGAEIGDTVTVNLEPKHQLMAFAAVFLVPVAFLIGGFILGYTLCYLLGFKQTQSFGVITGLVALAFSFVVVNKIDKIFSQKEEYRPILVKKG